MTANGWLQIALFIGVIAVLTRPCGRYMALVFAGRRTWLDRALRPIERRIYRVCGIDWYHEMPWTEYAAALLTFSCISMLALYALQRFQGWLPFNPEGLPAVSTYSSFNTAASFVTNTNWQAYAGETTMSYLTQMAGLAYQNFVSAAAGMSVAIALVRGIARRESGTLGNFWVDTTRGLLWILLPLCSVIALLFVSQGAVQNLKRYDVVHLVDGSGTQTIAQGPVASQEAIKQLGTNGGGFFNANSAHPFENPTPLTNFVSMVMIFLIPAGLTWTLGEMTGSRRHGWAVWAAMASLFLVGAAAAYWAEARGNPLLGLSGGNMEGKDVRFGIANSALFATVTTAASGGAVNAMHDSFTPLGGLVPLTNILLGEVVFGGVGAGLYGILVFIILTVFIAGLMVGRTPEYLGKKIEAYDVKMAMLAILIVPLTILTLTGIAVLSSDFGTSSVLNQGPHGLSEILYAYTSGAGNNGSAFAGLSANTHWYNATIGAAMLLGRFMAIIPMLALAGNLAAKKTAPVSLGTFPVTTPLFSALLVAVIVIVGALTFFPALSLGPIVEELLMHRGKVF
ncbi:MAG TPA: potassium-transporting ATPase subunit KdpA [Vicinamibacterales bacterium]|nr:potassium-transporting ATPase subunit KdpA [Vicinamibacterales bacterium]